MKKKILVIGPGMEIGGVERSLLGLLDSIDYGKYDVDLFLLSHSGEVMPLINKEAKLLPEEKRFALVSWPITELFKKGHFFVGMVRLYSKLYGALRAKITKTPSQNITICKRIISHLAKPLNGHYDFAFGYFAPHYFLETKVDAAVKIGWVHTDYSNQTEKQDTRYLRPMWEGLDRIACVSRGVKQAFDMVYPSLSGKAFVFENLISRELIQKQAEEFTVEREMPQDGTPNILSVGRYCNAKAFDEIPEACSILKNRGIDVRWYLIGYGPDEKLIQEKIKVYGMEDTVIMLGKRYNPYPYMKQCDLYAQPSRYEGRAVTVQEAQALGKPVMISRYSTSSSQIREGVDGYICEIGPQGMADGVQYLLTNTQIMEQLAHNAERQAIDTHQLTALLESKME